MRLLLGVICAGGLICGAGSASGVTSSSEPKDRAARLDAIIAEFKIEEGPDGIGGPSIVDVVEKLRSMAHSPVCLEEVAYDRERDRLTLGAALRRLRELKARDALPSPEEMRLRRYQELAQTMPNPEEEVIGVDKERCPLSERNLSLRGLLDRITQVCPRYVWSDEGGDDGPLIVIEPRSGGALRWPVSLPCEPAPVPEPLYVPGSRFSQLLGEHSISIIEFEPGQVPTVSMNLCDKRMDARGVLLETVRLLGGRIQWNLSGVKSLRFLTFGPVS